MNEKNRNTITSLGRTVGELALKYGLISAENLEKAVKTCADIQNSYNAIPDYLVAQNLISQKDCDRLLVNAKAMEAIEQDKKFGIIAIKNGFITESIFQLALDEQISIFKTKRKYISLGDILIDAGMLTSTQRDAILMEQSRSDDNNENKMENGAEKDTFYKNKNISKNNYKHDSTYSKENSSDPFESPTTANFAQSENFSCGIRLIIKGDGNAAYMFKIEGFDKNMSIGEIKELLASRNIIHGIADNNQIQKFIDSDIFFDKPFQIAKGNAPIQGKNASIQYFFGKKILKAGTIREDGTIDFRERGDIPQVERGTVLALKRNAVAGQVGKNIFNDTIRVTPARDIRLKAGQGAVLSPDKSKAVAAVSGHPKLGSDGTIYVYETFIVQGNVDFKTGNINYHGDVAVRGCIQNGFTVKAHNVKAEEADGAVIIADGNVIIEQGITESEISCQGSLTAKFIQRSKILCGGDVKTHKEVVESNIECAGTCNIKTVLIYSKVSAKMGLYAKQVGMEKSPPNTIKVGVDTFALRALEKLEQDIEEAQNRERTLNNSILSMENDISYSENKLARLNILKEKNDESQVADLNSKISKSYESIKELKNKIEESKKEIKETIIEKDSLLKEKSDLIEWIDKNPGVSIIRVEGDIMKGTRIIGMHTEDAVKSSVKAVIIREVQSDRINPKDNIGKDSEASAWKIYITKI